MATGVSINPAPIGASAALYPGPPPHQPYPTSVMSMTPRPPGHLNPPHALRRSMDLDQDPSPVQPPRQSLPSIHEALGNDNPLPYSGPSSSGPPSHPHPLSRPGTEGPAGPPNPFSNPNTYLREPQYSSQQGSTAAADQPRVSRVSLTSTQDSRKPSMQSVSGKSPTSSSKTAPTSISTTHSSSAYEYNPSASVVASPTSYASYPPQAYSWQSQPSASYDSHQYGHWKPNVEVMRNDEKGGVLGNRAGMPLHSDSVKRQFDSYDVESSLAEIIDGSTKSLDFSRHYATLAHQNQRSGPILGTLPSVHELDDVIQQHQRTHEAFMRIRNAVLSQEHALAEQRVQQRNNKVENGYDDERSGLYQDGFKSPSGFTAGDAKKRRGKAAPPGRCHSCNRAETPEWRRGPDGARTLCNACGLHYAKLTRKLGGANKATALGSTIKPKGIDSTSPAHQ
ncbi:hypothetical protein UA08_01489 [Talaromyces atroroseus]|uniref:GATA-type domain-containing protein n=1 Tax=Talaromyces atroroseus TaxID=1441469 RepID=A0A1Q5QC98_TALAT|nr:hypothetical protein UA08_01489 [Talaromyces atroroseus]OKL63582.1 hypothetical protein UA08_01489 [Talaromyces atroroseus]